MTVEPSVLHESDFFAWTQEQARLLRELRAVRPNLPLDLEHLAEEVEDLGLRERREVRSQVRRIIEHLLKLEHSAAAEPRGVWTDSVIDARAILKDALTSSLRRDLAEQLQVLHEDARRKAASGLRAHGEAEAAAALPVGCPYGLEQILQDDWYPTNRHGLVGPG